LKIVYATINNLSSISWLKIYSPLKAASIEACKGLLFQFQKNLTNVSLGR